MNGEAHMSHGHLSDILPTTKCTHTPQTWSASHVEDQGLQGLQNDKFTISTTQILIKMERKLPTWASQPLQHCPYHEVDIQQTW